MPRKDGEREGGDYDEGRGRYPFFPIIFPVPIVKGGGVYTNPCACYRNSCKTFTLSQPYGSFYSAGSVVTVCQVRSVLLDGKRHGSRRLNGRRLH